MLPEVRSHYIRAVQIRPAARPVVPCFRKSGRITSVRCGIARRLDRRCLASESPVAQRPCGADPSGGSTDGALLPVLRSLSVRTVRNRPAARPTVPCFRKSGRSPLVQFDRRLLAPKGFTAVFRFRRLRFEPPFLQVSAVRVPRPVHLEKSLPRNGFERAQPPSADPDGKRKRTINPKMRNQFIIARQRISVIWLFRRNYNQ